MYEDAVLQESCRKEFVKHVTRIQDLERNFSICNIQAYSENGRKDADAESAKLAHQCK